MCVCVCVCIQTPHTLLYTYIPVDIFCVFYIDLNLFLLFLFLYLSIYLSIYIQSSLFRQEE